jgi:hypothetical protein
MVNTVVPPTFLRILFALVTKGVLSSISGLVIARGYWTEPVRTFGRLLMLLTVLLMQLRHITDMLQVL